MHRGGLATPAGVTVASQWDGHAFRRAGTGPQRRQIIRKDDYRKRSHKLIIGPGEAKVKHPVSTIPPESDRTECSGRDHDRTSALPGGIHDA